MKTPAVATAKYVANGSSPAAAALWSADFIANMSKMFANAAKAIPFWQSQVSSAAAAAAMQKGLSRASANTGPIATKVQGPGSASFSAGVRVAGGPGGDYTAFIGPWLSAVGSEVQTLDQTYPRGTRAQNRARQAAYDAWVDQQGGNFRVK